MQEQIAILETSLAERWESLNVQDGIIDGLQEEIAALRESLGLLQIGHDHKATLLASCEIALGERDEKISTLQSDLAAAKESRDRESVAYDKLNNAFIDLNLDCDKLKAELARAREALIKIADWNGAWGTFPETNPQWAAMAVMTAREIAHKGEEG